MCHASFACSCWRRSGDLDPMRCKAESCGFGRCCMFVVAPLPKSKTPWRRREKGNHGTASSDLFLLGRRRASICVLRSCPPARSATTMMVPRASREYSSTNVTGCKSRSRRATDTTAMTNKLHIADIVLLLQACIPSTTPLHPRATPC